MLAVLHTASWFSARLSASSTAYNSDTRVIWVLLTIRHTAVLTHLLYGLLFTVQRRERGTYEIGTVPKFWPVPVCYLLLCNKTIIWLFKRSVSWANIHLDHPSCNRLFETSPCGENERFCKRDDIVAERNFTKSNFIQNETRTENVRKKKYFCRK